MESIFGNCKNLSSLPDISKWNTNNVKDMSFIFSHFINLSSLPDISKWNINKFTIMNDIFYGCN